MSLVLTNFIKTHLVITNFIKILGYKKIVITNSPADKKQID